MHFILNDAVSNNYQITAVEPAVNSHQQATKIFGHIKVGTHEGTSPCD